MQSLRYLILSAALGLITVWASENWFWFVPPPGMNAFEFAITALAYAIASACVLSAVILTRVGGWPAAFLGGSMLGYLVEGVVVGTMYEGFPWQLVWTPLAWHGLITGGVVLGVGRTGFGPGRLVLIWGLVGLVGAYWAQYWPVERPVLPSTGELALYLVALGGLVVLGQWMLDRVGDLPRPPLWVLGIAPVLMFMLWWYQVIAGFAPQMLAFPVLMGLLVWVMWRLGKRQAGPALGVPGGWRHGLFLIAPVAAVVLAPLGWTLGWGTLESNWVVAVGTGLVSLGVLGRLVWRAARLS
jgi:hypothetical protein